MQRSNNWGQRGEESGYARGTALKTPRSSKKEGGGAAAGARAEIPLQPMETTDDLTPEQVDVRRRL